jgi:hypothetical protein
LRFYKFYYILQNEALASYNPVTAAVVHAERKRPHPLGGRGTGNTERLGDRLTYVPSYGGWGTLKTVRLA